MKRIALFRYHNKPDLCKNRLELFHKFNPNVEVYGLYGGMEENFPEYKRFFRSYFKGNYCIENQKDIWKWKNGDLAYRLWYRDYGHTIEFDAVHILEWDLIMLDTLDNLYAHIPRESLGVTGLIPLRKIEKQWFWTLNEVQRDEWRLLKNHVQEQHGFSGPYIGSLAPGLCMPRSFLQAYAGTEVPDLCNDELRLPLFAQALGFEISDTGFLRKWFSNKEMKYFNCNEKDVSEKNLFKELKKNKGRRVFHPYREKIQLNEIMNKVEIPVYDSNLL